MTPDKVEAALDVLRWLASDNWNGLVPSMPMPEVVSVLTEALAERGWRPIESAPRDGTAIWVAGYMEHAKSWNCGCAKWENDGYTRAGWVAWGTSRFGASGLSAPTHWQPLPEPPHDR